MAIRLLRQRQRILRRVTPTGVWAVGVTAAVGLAACAPGPKSVATGAPTNRAASSPTQAAPPAAGDTMAGMPGMAAMGSGAMPSAVTLGPAARAAPAAGAGVRVGIVNFAFSPATVTVNAGQTVAWTNRDAITHTVTFSGGTIDSGAMAQGSLFSHTFTTPGTYPYICTIHPFMHGTVVVNP